MDKYPSARRKIVVRESGILARQRGTSSAGVVPAVPTALAVTDINDAMEAWLRGGAVKQLSAKTLAQRRDFLMKFQWYVTNKEHNPAIVDSAVIERFLIYVGHPLSAGETRWDSDNPRARRPVSPTTVKNFYRILRSWFNWLHAKKRISVNPITMVDTPVARAHQVEPYQQPQIDSLLAAAAGSQLPRRDTAICLVLLDTGLRATELCRLNVTDIDLASCSLSVTGKGGKRRQVWFGATVADALDAYLAEDVRRATDPVFVSASGARLNADSLLKIVRRLATAAGLSCRCNVHKFRHTFGLAFVRVRGGSGEFALQNAMGHTSLETTRRYVNAARADLANTMRSQSVVDNMEVAVIRRRGRPRKGGA